MATITSTGLGSGLNVTSIVAALMAVEQRPLTLMQSAKTELNTQLSAVGKLTSYTSAMRDAANTLSSVALWNRTVATSADATAIGVATDGAAASSSYSVSVTQLASRQTVTGSAVASKDSTLGEGTLTIELGSWTGEPTPTGFVAKTGSSAMTISIGAGETSLASIRDKINKANAGVTATIVTDANGARLSLSSRDTGASNAFRVTASETTDDGAAGTGLSALNYSAAGATQMARSQTAANAAATINGIALSSESNKLEGVADGLTLTLSKVTASAVEVLVKADDDAVKTAVTAFTKAFNDLAGYIRDNTKYDAGSKTGGTLQGDRTTGSLQAQLRGVINVATSASSTYTRLSDIGIVMKSDGTLETNSTKLDAAVANRTEMRKALATDGATSAVSGFMDRFRDLGNALLDTQGMLTTRNSSLQSMITRNQKSQDAMTLRLAQTEKRLNAQYQALDTSMSNMSGVSNYLSQQLAMLNSNA
ncbi:MAG: flagellar filament capping protein FliD [Rubrivivax sp.]